MTHVGKGDSRLPFCFLSISTSPSPSLSGVVSIDGTGATQPRSLALHHILLGHNQVQQASSCFPAVSQILPKSHKVEFRDVTQRQAQSLPAHGCDGRAEVPQAMTGGHSWQTPRDDGTKWKVSNLKPNMAYFRKFGEHGGIWLSCLVVSFRDHLWRLSRFPENS